MLVKGKLISLPQLFVTAEAVIGLKKIMNCLQRAGPKGVFYWMTVEVGILGNQVRSYLNKISVQIHFI